MSMQYVAAVDLGAESGRVTVANLVDDRIVLNEVHRFPNTPVTIERSLHWNPAALFDNILQGLSLAARRGKIVSIGIDTWGVDFALLGQDDNLLQDPYHYRDPRTEGMMERAFARVPREEIFERTGIQFLPINTLYMFLSMEGSEALGNARTLLTMPDLFNFWLTGRKVCEFTNATTTQLYDPRAGDWARGMIERLGLPSKIFPEVVRPGTILGPLLPSVAGRIGAWDVPVIAPACHDTGSAVAAIPAQTGNFAYISSGTWSLVGIETDRPVITPESMAENFTNEGGVGGTVRFLKNVMGLWILQECRRGWEAAGEHVTYDELTRMAERAAPFGPFIDPDDESFLRPGDMPGRIEAFCRKTGQRPPTDRPALVRCIFESLALKYRHVIDRIVAMTGKKIDVIHVVGGGSRNRLLCRMTADACGRPVVAGPVEATAIGNAIVQMIALGKMANLTEGRATVGRSFDMATDEPHHDPGWAAAVRRFDGIISSTRS